MLINKLNELSENILKKCKKNKNPLDPLLCFDCEGFLEGKQKKKLIRIMCNNSIPANAHNKVVAGENAKSVYVVYSTIVEQEITDIEGVYDNLDSAKEHFAYLKEWIRERWEDDYENAPEDIYINSDTDDYYDVYNECEAEKILLGIVEMEVENSFNFND